MIKFHWHIGDNTEIIFTDDGIEIGDLSITYKELVDGLQAVCRSVHKQRTWNDVFADGEDGDPCGGRE